MQYIKISFEIPDKAISDILVARLAEAGYDGFEETDNALYAYIEEPAFDKAALNPVADAPGMDYKTEIIPAQNWNEVWESNFDPVIIDDLCTIRANFHKVQVRTPYEIIITPKMSFGTGHHATTHMMMVMMKQVDFTGKSVLDFGTGTGVLAILAEKLGAASVTAIDNDEWPVDNAKENAAANNCSKIDVVLGSIEQAPDNYDVILANINRHILLEYMGDMRNRLNGNGVLLVSGLLEEDEPVIVQAAADSGLVCAGKMNRNGWIALRFEQQ